jgi:cell division topological specificity factor
MKEWVYRLIKLLRGEQQSKDVAKNRLHLILVQDRSGVDPELLKELRGDLIATISKYFDIDQAALEVEIQREEETVALVANIPIIRMKRPILVR